MRRITVLSLIAVSAAIVPATAAEAAQKRTCRVPAAATDIIRGSRVTMWTEKSSGAVRACHRAVGRNVSLWVPLDDLESQSGYGSSTIRGAVNGDMAGVAWHYWDKYATEDLRVTVADVRRRTSKTVTRSLWTLNPTFRETRPGGLPGITGFVLSPLGTGAVTYSWTTPWTVASFDPLRAPDRFDVLDTDVEPGGLRLASRTEIEWRHGGQPRRAALPSSR